LRAGVGISQTGPVGPTAPKPASCSTRRHRGEPIRVVATLLWLASACVTDLVVDTRAQSTETGEASDATTEGTIPCDDEKVLCDGKCVRLAEDPDHCGSCGEVCSAELACDAGECAADCSGGRTKCERKCVDLQGDRGHCGDCDIACAELEACIDSECRCVEPLVACGDRCVYTATDPDHCGECFHSCAGDPCGLGECRPGGCPDGTTPCGLSCADVSSHPLHCGECDASCELGKTCVGGDCRDP